MTRRRTILLFVLVIAIITILRETGTIELNYYNASINSTNSSNWNNKHFTSSDSGFFRVSEGECIPTDISQIPVYINAHSGGFFKEFDSPCDQLVIDLSYSSNSGSIWMPLYKNVHFSGRTSCFDKIKIIEEYNGTSVCNIHSLSGAISIKGQIRVTGICSSREVKRLITNELVKNIQSAGRQELRQLQN
jgi:hypothetical protein